MTTAPMKLIRTSIFGIRQDEMGTITGASQATVSRWENGELEPNREQMAAIRLAAQQRDLEWRDEWFFDAATIPQEPQRAA